MTMKREMKKLRSRTKKTTEKEKLIFTTQAKLLPKGSATSAKETVLTTLVNVNLCQTRRQKMR